MDLLWSLDSVDTPRSMVPDEVCSILADDMVNNDVDKDFLHNVSETGCWDERRTMMDNESALIVHDIVTVSHNTDANAILSSKCVSERLNILTHSFFIRNPLIRS